MFSRTRAAIAAALAIVALTSFPALAADGLAADGVGAERVAGTAMPAVDFTLATDGTYVAGVLPSIPPAMLANVLADVLAAPAVPAPQAQRPIDIAMPRGEGGFSETTLRRGMYGSFAALQVMDMLSTSKALAAGGVEANPAMSGVVKNKNAFMAVKVGAAVATAFFAEKLAKNHPRKATILMAVLNVAYAGIVVHNYNVSRSGR